MSNLAPMPYIGLDSDIEINSIKAQLVEACLTNEDRLLATCIESERVRVKSPTKYGFYSYLKGMLECRHKDSIGTWYLEIDGIKISDDGMASEYQFYDRSHYHYRLCINVITRKDDIVLEVLPF